MSRVSSKINSPYVIAFLFTLFSLLLFLVTEPGLSAAGDMNIAEYLASSKIEPGFFFISPALAYILRLFNAVYTANWWVIFSVMVMFGGLFVFLWFLNKRASLREWSALLFVDGLFVLFFWELMLKYDINFTQTTTIAGLAAILLILDCCYDCDYEKAADRKFIIVKICAGVCLLFLSGSIRWKALALMLPFAVMCLGFFFLFPCRFSDLKESLINSFKTKKKILLLAGMIVLAAFISYGMHKLYGVMNPDLGEYVKANALREEICDYADQYPDYDENAEMYQELGIQQSWIDMVCAFLTGDENHFSSSDLSKMAQLRQSSHMTVRTFTGSLKGHAVMWISLGGLLVFLAYLKGGANSLVPFAGCLFAFVLCGLYFVAIGRIEWRVTNGCILACVLSFTAMASHSVYEVPVRKFSAIGNAALLVLAAVFFIVGLVAVRLEKGFSLPIAAVTDEERAGMLDYIDGNPDIVYLDVEESIRYYNAHNLWSAHEPEYMDNAISLIAHFAMGERITLAAAGIDDIISDMLKEPDIYVRYCSSYSNGIFLCYLRDYYDPCVSVSVVDRYGSTRFLRYSRPINIGGETGGNITIVDAVFETVDEFPDDEDIITAVQVSCRLNSDNGNDYEDYYLNITDHTTELLYSYGLKAQESGCDGEVLWLNETWSADHISVSLVGQCADGSYDMIADVTETFCASLQASDGLSDAEH